MSRAVSPSTQRPYGVVWVAREWELSRSTYYGVRHRQRCPAPGLRRRGPRTPYTDADLTAAIRAVLRASPFTGEGHRKVWARLRARGIRTSKSRVLRLMREAGLLAPGRPQRLRGPRHHDGTIIPERPDALGGTDATSAWTLEEGQATVFVAVDHATCEGVGIHAAKVGTRFEALEPIRQGVRARFGAFAEARAQGLTLRHDHGSPYRREAFPQEIRFLGIASSPAFVRAPEGNGCAERFIRTLKEQRLWVRSFRSVEALRLSLQAWMRTYNAQWLIERHGYRSPAQARRALLGMPVAA